MTKPRPRPPLRPRKRRSPQTARERLAIDCELAVNELMAAAYVHTLDRQRLHDQATRAMLGFVTDTFESCQQRIADMESTLSVYRQKLEASRKENAKLNEQLEDARRLRQYPLRIPSHE